MTDTPRWLIAHAGACDMECGHLACKAWDKAGGDCLICTRPMTEAFFAYRSNGTGASHPWCRLNQLASHLTFPRVAVGGGDIQVGLPQNDDEAEALESLVEAARRFVEAGEGALGAYGGTDVVVLLKENRRG